MDWTRTPVVQSSFDYALSRCTKQNLNFIFFNLLKCIGIQSEAKKRDTFKYWPLIKNPQFLSYPYETWWKLLTLDVITFTKFHEVRTKIVDFLLMANFWKCPVFLPQTLVQNPQRGFMWNSIVITLWNDNLLYSG